MPMTIGQYALDRGYSRTAIYKAIDRTPELQSMTYKGISKGKETTFLSDEGIEILDATMQPSAKSNESLKKNLELAIRDREAQLLQERNEIVSELTNKLTDISERLHQEKEEEMMITRTEMIKRIENVGSGVQEILDQIRSSYEIRIRELNDKLSKLETENNHYKVENARLSEDVNRLKTSCKQLTARIRFAQNHPVKFMIQGKDEELPGAEA